MLAWGPHHLGLLESLSPAGGRTVNENAYQNGEVTTCNPYGLGREALSDDIPSKTKSGQGNYEACP